MKERSLDEFIGGTPSEEEIDTPGEEDTETPDEEKVNASDENLGDDSDGDSQTDEESQEAIEPATSTAYVFPEGVGCDTCEATVTRLWPADGNRVCGSCKEW